MVEPLKGGAKPAPSPAPAAPTKPAAPTATPTAPAKPQVTEADCQTAFRLANSKLEGISGSPSVARLTPVVDRLVSEIKADPPNVKRQPAWNTTVADGFSLTATVLVSSGATRPYRTFLADPIITPSSPTSALAGAVTTLEHLTCKNQKQIFEQAKQTAVSLLAHRATERHNPGIPPDGTQGI